MDGNQQAQAVRNARNVSFATIRSEPTNKLKRYDRFIQQQGTTMARLFFCAAIMLGTLGIASASDEGRSGFTLQQLNAAMNSSGVGSQRIESILTFRDLGDSGAHVALLSSGRSGWHVTILHNVSGGLKVEWKSGALRDDFSVSSPDALEIDDLGDEQVIEFSGCARHMCGGVDGGVFGMVLYAPRAKQAFFAHYSYDDHKPKGSFGSLDFSTNTETAGNERYRAALERAMKKKLGV